MSLVYFVKLNIDTNYLKFIPLNYLTLKVLQCIYKLPILEIIIKHN